MTLARLERATKRYGVSGLPKRVWVHAKRRLVGGRPLIYSRRGPIEGEPPSGLTVERFSRWDEIGAGTAVAISDSEGSSATGALQKHVGEGRTLWVARQDGEVAGYLLTARGSQAAPWLMPIADDDLILYSVVVIPTFRGRGIAPALAGQVLRSELEEGQSAYIDTRAWNESAIRFIDKADFRPVAAGSGPWSSSSSRWTALVALVPMALTLYLGFNSGGFYPGAVSVAAVLVGVAVVLCLLLTRRPFAGFNVPSAIAAVALAAFAGWVLLSANWSDSTVRALPEYARVLLYGLTLVLFSLISFDARRIRWMLYGFAAAIVGICIAGLIARTLPEVILDPALLEKDRLGYPLTYWNALGLLAGLGVILCGHLACSTRDPWPVRILGAASVPLVTLTLYYTLSRGATWAAVGAIVVYVLVGRPRGLLFGAIATGPPTLILLMIANPTNDLTEGPLINPTSVPAGEHVVTVLVACMIGAALLRALMLPLDRRVEEFHLSDRARLPIFGGVTAVGLLVIVGLGISLDVPGIAQDKYDQFTSQNESRTGEGSSRLLSAETNGRQDHWDVALAEFRRDRLHGAGAGTYALAWLKERPGTVHVKDAHSLYLETLGELGIVGLALLVIALCLMLGALAYRARGPDRTMFAALFGAGLAWAVASGVDWSWEMPAVTAWLFAFGGAALARSSSTEGGPPGWGAAVARVIGVVAVLVLMAIPARTAISVAHYDDALQSFRAGNCRGAKVEAREAISVMGQRVGPYGLIAFCDMQRGRFRLALPTVRQALERDPQNWELVYMLAVARAGAGLDPRNAANRAVRLNPNSKIAQDTKLHFQGKSRSAWERIADDTPLLPPGPGDP